MALISQEILSSERRLVYVREPDGTKKEGWYKLVLSPVTVETYTNSSAQMQIKEGLIDRMIIELKAVIKELEAMQ